MPKVEREALTAFAACHGNCSVSLILSSLVCSSGIVDWYEANDGSDPPAGILRDREIDLEDDVLRSLAVAAAKEGVSVNEMLNHVLGEQLRKAKRLGGLDKLLDGNCEP